VNGILAELKNTELKNTLGDRIKIETAEAAGGGRWDVLPIGQGLPAAPRGLAFPEKNAMEAYEDEGGAASLEYAEASLDLELTRTFMPPSTQRSLVADLPESVNVKDRFSIEVRIAEVMAGSPPIGSPLAVEGGMNVTVNATVPGSFEVQSELTQDIEVPMAGDSTPRLFTFVPGKVGTFPVRFTAYNGGTYLGKLDVEVTVAESTSGTSRYTLESLSLDPPRRGEVSLQITYVAETNTFRFLFIAGGERYEVPSHPIEGDIRDRIEKLVLESDSYARADSDLSPQDAEDRLRDNGFQMWEDLVPGQVKSAIIKHLDKMSQLTIFCDREIVPWELLYPQLPDGREPGFLVQLCPVTRWVMGSQWEQALSLSAPTFVIPDKSPASAEREVGMVAGRLHAVNPGKLSKRKAVLTAIEEPDFTCLHFACHNLYAQQDGSQIRFEDGPLRPSDMARKVAKRPLADKQALVFLNACRTQGAVPVYTSLENWAKMFLDLGATAVIGTSWAVRSNTARLFAETVYDNLASGKNLGQAVEAARRRASAKTGDSSWLAYTVYGDPTAVAVT
jgi:hypothetical protein